MTQYLWCLHGNLQQPDVWRPFEGQFTTAMSQYGAIKLPLPLQTENLWQSNLLGFWPWAADFCQKVERTSQGERQYLLGYSQGGRLALHALLTCPSLWRGAIVVGADTGFTTAAERAARLSHDAGWAARFLTEPWKILMDDWDSQSVFGGRSNTAPRREADFRRAKIARVFDVFSKGRQDDLMPLLIATEADLPPILFISGCNDPKYSQIGAHLAAHLPAVKHAIVNQAAHRVPWENPTDFIEVVQAFLYKISSG